MFEVFWMLQLGIQTSFCRHLVPYKTLGKLRGAWVYQGEQRARVLAILQFTDGKTEAQ